MFSNILRERLKRTVGCSNNIIRSCVTWPKRGCGSAMHSKYFCQRKRTGDRFFRDFPLCFSRGFSFSPTFTGNASFARAFVDRKGLLIITARDSNFNLEGEPPGNGANVFRHDQIRNGEGERVHWRDNETQQNGSQKE